MIDADIRRAATLPAAVYCDPKYLELQRERIFARAWHLVPPEGGPQVPGQVRPWTLLEGLLDEPLVLTCDEARRVRCLSNVCTHRGNRLVEEAGAARGLRCRYHGRRFDLAGRMLAAPGFEDALDFPSERDHLPSILLESWRGLSFAALDPAMPFEAWIQPVRERVDWLPLEQFVFDPATSRDYQVAANWALYCDNYLEGFHIPFVHAGLAGALDWPAYRTELFAFSSLQIGVARAGEPAFEVPGDHPDRGLAVAAWYYWLFPGTMLNFYPWGLSVNLVEPLAVDRTRVRFLSYLWRPELRDRGAGSGLDQVELEDEAVVEGVQRGIRSRLYRQGRYSPRLETGVHHFHRLLVGAMDEPE